MCGGGPGAPPRPTNRFVVQAGDPLDVDHETGLLRDLAQQGVHRGLTGADPSPGSSQSPVSILRTSSTRPPSSRTTAYTRGTTTVGGGGAGVAVVLDPLVRARHRGSAVFWPCDL